MRKQEARGECEKGEREGERDREGERETHRERESQVVACDSPNYMLLSSSGPDNVSAFNLGASLFGFTSAGVSEVICWQKGKGKND